MAAFTKPEAPAPAWTTFEGYDEGANTFGSQPSVEILGEETEEDQYAYDDAAYGEHMAVLWQHNIMEL